MRQHTPGPWTTDEAEHDAPNQDIRIGSVMHHTVCTVWIDDAPVHEFNAEQRANARLIAAAPELLAALMAAKRHLYVDSVEWDAADAAIDKATGAA